MHQQSHARGADYANHKNCKNICMWKCADREGQNSRNDYRMNKIDRVGGVTDPFVETINVWHGDRFATNRDVQDQDRQTSGNRDKTQLTLRHPCSYDCERYKTNSQTRETAAWYFRQKPVGTAQVDNPAHKAETKKQIDRIGKEVGKLADEWRLPHQQWLDRYDQEWCGNPCEKRDKSIFARIQHEPE